MYIKLYVSIYVCACVQMCVLKKKLGGSRVHSTYNTVMEKQTQKMRRKVFLLWCFSHRKPTFYQISTGFY